MLATLGGSYGQETPKNIPVGVKLSGKDAETVEELTNGTATGSIGVVMEGNVDLNARPVVSKE
jgi:hypothetical protein